MGRLKLMLEVARDFFVKSGVAEECGDDALAGRLRAMGLAVRDMVQGKPERPRHDEAVSAPPTQAEPLNSEDAAPDEVSALLEIPDLSHFNSY